MNHKAIEIYSCFVLAIKLIGIPWLLIARSIYMFLKISKYVTYNVHKINDNHTAHRKCIAMHFRPAKGHHRENLDII